MTFDDKIKLYSYYNISRLLYKLNYRMFKGVYNLNFVFIRSAYSVSNKFDDVLAIFYLDKTHRHRIEYFPCTTDPGKYWLLHPMRRNGTAVVMPQQVISSHKAGLHKGKPALVQQKPLKFVRDNTRDEFIDESLYLDDKGLVKKTGDNIYTGVNGLNIHRASSTYISKLVDKWSAGCLVIPDPANMDYIIGLVEQQRKRGLGDRITFTLVRQNDFKNINI